MLPPGFESRRRLLRAFAFRDLLAGVWREDPQRAGHGELLAGALRAVAALIEAVGNKDSLHTDRAAWLLGLLAEAADDTGVAAARKMIRSGLPVYLDALDARAAAGSVAQPAPDRSGLLFLVGHFTEDAALINRRLDVAFGAEAPAAQAIAAVFATAASRPERSRFILSYLGAEGCHSSCDATLALYEQTLACPACRGQLRYGEQEIACMACGQAYGWHGDIPDLVGPGCADPEQFPQALVDIYESQTRPRFVRVMAGDWGGLVTMAREADYLARFLRPVDGPVVDLACGAGGWTALVAGRVGPSRVIALDLSVPMLAACQRAVPAVVVVRGSSSALPFADGSLGGMNCSDALQALPDPALAFEEASRCLRPGAPFTVFTFREAPAPYAYFQHRFPASMRPFFSDPQIRDMAQRAALDIVDLGGPEQAMFLTARKRG